MDSEGDITSRRAWHSDADKDDRLALKRNMCVAPPARTRCRACLTALPGLAVGCVEQRGAVRASQADRGRAVPQETAGLCATPGGGTVPLSAHEGRYRNLTLVRSCALTRVVTGGVRQHGDARPASSRCCRAHARPDGEARAVNTFHFNSQHRLSVSFKRFDQVLQRRRSELVSRIVYLLLRDEPVVRIKIARQERSVRVGAS